MATIKDVARLAGVSTSTVSRTLSNRMFVEEETRQKVLKAVEELNYQPSVLARSLREGKTYMLAFLVPDINSFFYPSIMNSMEHSASEAGYSMILCNSHEDIENEKKVMNMLGSRGIDGLFCMSVSDDIRHLKQFQTERGIPVVLVNRRASDPEMSSVYMDSEHGAWLMTKYLLEQGHRKIAALFVSGSEQRFRARVRGCRRAMEEYHVEGYDRFFYNDINTIEDAYRATEEILAREDRPTAFFASMDTLAIGIYSAVAHSGLRIPQDISVVGYDDILFSRYLIPPLTTYHVSVDILAAKSMENLAALMKDPRDIRKVNLTGNLVERGSVRRL